MNQDLDTTNSIQDKSNCNNNKFSNFEDNLSKRNNHDYATSKSLSSNIEINLNEGINNLSQLRLSANEDSTNVKDESLKNTNSQEDKDNNLNTNCNSMKSNKRNLLKSSRYGRWLFSEHFRFLKGVYLHGNKWEKVKEIVKTRSTVQIRSHAQKYLLKITKNFKKRIDILMNNSNNNINKKDINIKNETKSFNKNDDSNSDNTIKTGSDEENNFNNNNNSQSINKYDNIDHDIEEDEYSELKEKKKHLKEDSHIGSEEYKSLMKIAEIKILKNFNLVNSNEEEYEKAIYSEALNFGKTSDSDSAPAIDSKETKLINLLNYLGNIEYDNSELKCNSFNKINSINTSNNNDKNNDKINVEKNLNNISNNINTIDKNNDNITLNLSKKLNLNMENSNNVSLENSLFNNKKISKTSNFKSSDNSKDIDYNNSSKSLLKKKTSLPIFKVIKDASLVSSNLNINDTNFANNYYKPSILFNSKTDNSFNNGKMHSNSYSYITTNNYGYNLSNNIYENNILNNKNNLYQKSRFNSYSDFGSHNYYNNLANLNTYNPGNYPYITNYNNFYFNNYIPNNDSNNNKINNIQPFNPELNITNNEQINEFYNKLTSINNNSFVNTNKNYNLNKSFSSKSITPVIVGNNYEKSGFVPYNNNTNKGTKISFVGTSVSNNKQNTSSYRDSNNSKSINNKDSLNNIEKSPSDNSFKSFNSQASGSNNAVSNKQNFNRSIKNNDIIIDNSNNKEEKLENNKNISNIDSNNSKINNLINLLSSEVNLIPAMVNVYSTQLSSSLCELIQSIQNKINNYDINDNVSNKLNNIQINEFKEKAIKILNVLKDIDHQKVSCTNSN